jgi:hypothetical protein
MGDHWPWEARELDPQKPFNKTAFPKHRKEKTHPHPLASFSNLQRAWNNLTANIDWWAPRGLYWICGKQTYTVLPSSWFGSCVLGSIRHPSSCFPLDQVNNWKSPYMKKD